MKEENMVDVIVCGYGTVGQRVIKSLKNHNISFIAIDKKPIEKNFSDFIVGDATSEEILKKADVISAKTVVAATDSDATNAFICLLAKTINKHITILSRVGDVTNIEKLDKAGADYVFSMSTVGRFIAKSAIEPFVAHFLDMVNVKEGMEIMQIKVEDNSKISGKSIKKAKIWKKTGAHIVAIRRGEKTIYSPSEDENILNEDRIIAIGNADQVKALYSYVEPDKPFENIK
jgi:voltage-gated potassium channel